VNVEVSFHYASIIVLYRLIIASEFLVSVPVFFIVGFNHSCIQLVHLAPERFYMHSLASHKLQYSNFINIVPDKAAATCRYYIILGQ
jgi:hypothetical protein